MIASAMWQKPVISISLGWIALAVLLAVVLLVGLAVLFTWRYWQRRARAVSNSSSWLPDLLNALPVAALVADQDGQVIINNIEAARLLRLSDHDQDLPLTLRTLVQRVLVFDVSETTEIPAPDDGQRRLRVTVTALGAEDSPGNALVLVSDPVELRERETGYRRLIGTISHELRTPLTAIMSHVDILGSCTIEEEALWRRSQSFIAGEVDRLARLVDDLLSLSHLETTPSQMRPVNVRAIAEEAISTLWEAAEQAQVALQLQSSPGLPRVLADPDRLQQVFISLLDNAIKYSSGEATATIRLYHGGDSRGIYSFDQTVEWVEFTGWSPDGQQIACWYWDGSEHKAFLINADGSGEPLEVSSIPDSWYPWYWPQWQ
ncbi:MAG: histidine kinase dimerization/phospho-acceptor domain-containing protein [Chloroflexota bacterium]|nr:histidine kinase dimerization/phospho-acceptor domain-containing protein [Chloroflexota bacterium]